MTTFNISGISVTTNTGATTAVSSSTISFVGSDDLNFKYETTGEAASTFAAATLTIGTNRALYSLLIDGTRVNAATDLAIAEYQWSDTSTVPATERASLILRVATSNPNVFNYYVLDGDALPAFANVAAYDAFLASLTSFTSVRDDMEVEKKEGYNLYAEDFQTTMTENDTVIGSVGDDWSVDALRTGKGSDVVIGTAGNDKINTGYTGNDTIEVANDRDTVDGGNGDDYISTGIGNDYVSGGEGNDTVYSGASHDTVYGGNGDDSLYTSSGNDTVSAGAGADLINADIGHDYVYGSSGNDTILGGSGQDTLVGGSDDDSLSGSTGNDILDGELGNDTMIGDVGNDSLYGDHGNDRLDAGSGSDLLNGGDGNDALIGGSGIDSIYGGAGNDTVSAGTENDAISGDGGADVIRAGLGNDTVNGGTGNDVLYGNGGVDRFVFEAGDGDDVIYDFGNNVDTLVLNGMTGLVDWADLSANHAVQTGRDVVLTFGTDEIIVKNITIAQLQDDVSIL